ncbi:MAG: hypothetical protein Q7S78_01070 [Candidatus Azambacteria bacterium]|nr:hypothetical protein [Candidatus Azambacteria bacterium]
MGRGDVRLEIIYKFNDHGNDLIRTNAKKEMISEILGNWMCSQIGRGENRGKRNEIDSYQIVIELDLRDDTFYTTSNTGNAGLTAGIIIDIVERLKEIEIVNL